MNRVNILTALDIIQDFLKLNQPLCSDVFLSEETREESQAKRIAAYKAIEFLQDAVRAESVKDKTHLDVEIHADGINFIKPSVGAAKALEDNLFEEDPILQKLKDIRDF